MPTYVYAVIKPDGSQGEPFEVFQKLSDPALTVHPETGERGPEIFPRLKQVLGHNQVGMRVEVLRGGLVRPGDAVDLIA